MSHKPASLGMKATFQALQLWVNDVFSEAKIKIKQPYWVGETEMAIIKTIYGTKYNYTITIRREKIT